MVSREHMVQRQAEKVERPDFGTAGRKASDLTFDEWIADETLPNNVWCYESKFMVYVRRTRHITFDWEMRPCLDLASIEVYDPEDRGKGIFKAFLLRFEAVAAKLNRIVYVETVQEPRLIDYLKRQGYTPTVGSAEFIPTLCKQVC